MSALGLGRVKTLGLGEDFVEVAGHTFMFFWSDYALIAAMSGWMPIMFMTRVKL